MQDTPSTSGKTHNITHRLEHSANTRRSESCRTILNRMGVPVRKQARRQDLCAARGEFLHGFAGHRACSSQRNLIK